MRIRFITADGISEVKYCPGLEWPRVQVYRPLWTGIPQVYQPQVDVTMPGTIGRRCYEWRGEMHNGIPVVHEIP